MANAQPGPSANLSFINPTYGQQLADLQTEREMAANLLEQGSQPIQQTTAGRFVVPISPMQGLAKVVESGFGGYLRGQANQDAVALQAQQNGAMQGLFGMGGSGGTPATPGYTPAAASPAYDSMSPSDQVAADVASDPTGTSSMGSSASPGAGMLQMPGLTPEQSYLAYNLDPQGYMEARLKAGAPTDDQKNAMFATGGNVGAAQGAIAGKLTKEGYIAPTSVRAGGWVMRPDGTTQYMPNIGQGQQPVYDAQGNVAGVQNMPGAEQAAFNQSQATAAGPASVKPVTAYDANGNPVATTQLALATGNNNPYSAYQAPVQAGQPGAAGQGADAGASGPLTLQPPLGVSTMADAAAKAAQGRYDGLISQAAGSPARVGILNNIINLSQQGVQTGPTQEWQNAVVGSLANTPVIGAAFQNAPDNISKFQELQKYLRQNATQTWQAAGGTGTDAQLEAFENANPNDHMFPQALQATAQWLKAGETAVQAKAMAAQQAAPNGFKTASDEQAFENNWRQNFDPRVYQMAQLPPQQQVAFAQQVQQSDPQGAVALARKLQVARQNGWVQ